MTSVTQAAMAASVIVGMISLPAVSQTAPTQQQQLPNVTDSTPAREIVKSSSPDGFEAKVSTAFQDFVTSVGSKSANASLRSSTSKLEVHRSPSSTRWVLTAPSGRMTLERNPQRVIERTETAYGTLETVRADGGVTERFEGSNRSQVENAQERLRELMNEKKQEMDQKRNQLGDTPSESSSDQEQETKEEQLETVDTDLKLIATESTASGIDGNNTLEHVKIENTGNSSISLDSYTLEDSDDSFDLPDRNLDSGETVKVFTNTLDEVGTDYSGIFGSGLRWTNSGETARLLKDGKLAVEKTYP